MGNSFLNQYVLTSRSYLLETLQQDLGSRALSGEFDSYEDVNNDDLSDIDDYLYTSMKEAGLQYYITDNRQEKFVRLFEYYDTNNDGKLDLKDKRAYFRNQTEQAEQRIQTLAYKIINKENLLAPTNSDDTPVLLASLLRTSIGANGRRTSIREFTKAIEGHVDEQGLRQLGVHSPEELLAVFKLASENQEGRGTFAMASTWFNLPTNFWFSDDDAVSLLDEAILIDRMTVNPPSEITFVVKEDLPEVVVTADHTQPVDSGGIMERIQYQTDNISQPNQTVQVTEPAPEPQEPDQNDEPAVSSQLPDDYHILSGDCPKKLAEKWGITETQAKELLNPKHRPNYETVVTTSNKEKGWFQQGEYLNLRQFKLEQGFD